MNLPINETFLFAVGLGLGIVIGYIYALIERGE